MPRPDVWKASEEGERLNPRDLAAIRLRAEAEARKREFRNANAAARAEDLISSAKLGRHAYLELKGFPDKLGLILEDGALGVPMRNFRTNALQGLQVIRWLPTERRYQKLMLPGTKAAGAALCLGDFRSRRVWLCEGYATGLSILEALRMMSSSASVLVCFSAGNLPGICREVSATGRECYVFADNDKSSAGQAAAEQSGAPYVMSDIEGEDANDLHCRSGIWAVRSAIGRVMK